MEEEIPLDPPPTLLVCPECGEEVEVARQEWAQEIICPHCGQLFLVAALDGSTELRESEIETMPETDEELDGLRIRNLAGARRAAYRSRSHAIVVGLACLVGAIQLVIMTVQRTREPGWDVRCVGFIGFAIFGLYGTWFFLRRAMEMHREAKRSALAQTNDPPDFSTLSDGSQRWRDLENIR